MCEREQYSSFLRRVSGTLIVRPVTESWQWQSDSEREICVRTRDVDQHTHMIHDTKESDMKSKGKKTEKIGLCCFKKGHISGTLRPYAEGVPPPLLVELPSVESEEGAGPPDGWGHGSGTVGSSKPVFLLTTSEVSSMFLCAPNASTPCASSAYSSITTISFHNIPSNFGVYLCSLSVHSHTATSFSTARSKSSSSLRCCCLLNDDPLLPLAWEQPPDRPGPTRSRLLLIPEARARQICLQRQRSELRGAAPLGICPSC